MVAVRCSTAASAPSSVRNSSRTPGSPVPGSRSADRGGSGTRSQVTQPGRTVTWVSGSRPASASVSAAAGVDTLTWGTVALPPPWVTGLTVFGPITARLRIVPRSRGSTPPSLRSSVNAAAATWRSSAGSARTGARPFGAPFGVEGSRSSRASAGEAIWVGASPIAPTRRANRRMRSTLASTASSLTCPARTASTSWPPHGPSGPGMARSRPATAVATVLRAACQSDSATPAKPHSSLRMRPSSGPCSVIVVPLTLLYPVITRSTSASRTQASNGTRYSSRSTCSAILAS